MTDPSSETSDTAPGPYGLLARYAVRYRVLVIVGLLVLTTVAGILGLPPKVDNNVLSMMPEDDPVIDATRALDAEGAGEFLTLGFVQEVEDGEEADPEVLAAYARDLAGRFDALDSVSFVYHEIDPDLAYQIGLLQLDPEDVAELTARMRGAVALGPALNPVVIQRLMDMGPVTERLAKAQDASVLGSDGRMVRLLVRPVKSARDRAFALAFYDEVQEVLAADPPEAHGVRLAWMGGSYRHTVEDIRTLQRDLGWTSGVAAVLVLLILFVAFRDLRAVAIVFLPIIVANVLTLGLIGLWIGHLNTFTAAGVPVLIGLGIDFAVHLFGRYREWRTRGLSVEEALERAWDRTGPPCMTAGLTSAGGFLALMAATFQGFAQFGLMLAFGLLACLLTMLVVLPPLVSWFDRNPKRALPGARIPDEVESQSTYRLAPTGLMIAVIVTGVAGAIAIPRLGFDFDISSMRSEGHAYDELTELERDLATKSYAPIVVQYDTAEKRNKGQQRLNEGIEEGDVPFASGTVSRENVLPSDMERRIDAIGSLAEVVRHPNLRYVHASPARPMVEALMPLREVDPKPLTPEDLPEGLLEVMGGGAEDTHRLLVLPQGNLWDMRNALALTRAVQQRSPEGEIAGSVSVQGLLYSYVIGDIPLVGGLALLLVGLLTAIDLRKPLFTIGALGTLVAGLVWAGVALKLAGVQLSIVNMMGVPILLGIGIDVVIHLLHRLREEGPGGVRRAWRTTGVAALVSTSTTVASFAALMLAESRGIESLGLLVVVGLSTITVVGAGLLPLAWAAGWRVTGQAPGQNEG